MTTTVAPLPSITGDLDPGIAPIVYALRDAGFRTLASCQGGDGHAALHPTVSILPEPRHPIHQTRVRLIRWIRNQHLDGCYISEVWPIITSNQNGSRSTTLIDGRRRPIEAPHIHIEWWGPEVLERWAGRT